MNMVKVERGEKCPCCGRYYARQVAVDAIGVKDGKLVLVKRSKEPDKGMWALPGGMLDWDENAGEAAIREFGEETGLQAKLGRFVGVYSNPDRDQFQRVAIAYEVKIIGGKLKAGDDALDARWFSVDDLPALAVDHKKMVEEYKKRIRNNE